MLRVYGVEVDAIEVFVYHVLVQEPNTGLIYLVLLDDLEVVSADPDTDTDSEITKILSLKGWKEWQKNPQKQDLQKSKNKRPSPRQKPQLRIVSK